MLAIVPPSAWARAGVAEPNFPLALYAVNGVLPLTICARYGMWWAVVLGFAAMALPLALALRAERKVGAPRAARTSSPELHGATAQ